MTNGVKVDLEKPTPLTVLNAVPEVPGKSGAGYYGIAESGETYLETILLIKERTQSGLVRAVDIANELGFSKPSVSRALGQLKDKGLITIEFSGAIVFTPEGLEYAKKRYLSATVFLLTSCAMFSLYQQCKLSRMLAALSTLSQIPPLTAW